jgi:hypothetical protein
MPDTPTPVPTQGGSYRFNPETGALELLEATVQTGLLPCERKRAPAPAAPEPQSTPDIEE